MRPTTGPDRAPRRGRNRERHHRSAPLPRQPTRDCNSIRQNRAKVRYRCETPPVNRETGPDGNADPLVKVGPKVLRPLVKDVPKFDTRLTKPPRAEDAIVPGRSGPPPENSRLSPRRVNRPGRARRPPTAAGGSSSSSVRTRRLPARSKAKHHDEPKPPRPVVPAPTGALRTRSRGQAGQFV